MTQDQTDVAPLRENVGKDLPDFFKRHAQTLRIVLFEGIGTLMLAYGVCCGQYLPPLRDKIPNPFYNIFVSCALFLALCWSGSITGGHINPAVTLGQMFRTPKVSLKTGFIYMLSQFIGAFVGSLLAWGFYDAVAGPYDGKVQFSQLFLDFIGEIIGTFLFVFFILMITTPETTFVEDKHWIYIFISFLLYTCRTFSFRVEGLNPAVALGVMIFKTIKLKDGILLAYTICIILGPFLGGYLAGVFFQKVYKKIYVDWKQSNSIQ